MSFYQTNDKIKNTYRRKNRMAITASNAVKILKEVVKDYNYWGESESDSPLSIKRAKTGLDEKRILALDASARKKAAQIQDYKAPTRNVRTSTLEQVFQPLCQNAFNQLTQAQSQPMENWLTPVEALEYYVELYSIFKQLTEPSVFYVEDTAGDPYTGLFITGKSSDGETIYAQSLLVQT